jgi:hypothetical protein
MITKKEFIIGLVILFFAFFFVNGLIISDINETMRTLKRPVVLHDTTSVMRYVDRYIHDTVYTTINKTEYIEKVSLIGKMQDYADPEEKETTFKLETDEHLFEFDAKYVKFQCNGKFVETEDETVCAGDWVFTAKEIIE